MQRDARMQIAPRHRRRGIARSYPGLGGGGRVPKLSEVATVAERPTSALQTNGERTAASERPTVDLSSPP